MQGYSIAPGQIAHTMSANIEQVHIELSSASLWQHLEKHATSTTTAALNANDANATQNLDLPCVSPAGKPWNEFTSSKTLHQPYVQQLNQSTHALREFIQQHAANSPQKQKALANIQDFAATKVNCRPTALTPLMVNENRRNLHLIAQQLQNNAIPLQQRTGIALALAEGLNVCAEGTTLNILSCASELINQQQGLAGLVIKIKNQSIDQQLLQLVKHIDSRRLNLTQAKALEIHHVQALKNHVASQWGLTAVTDRYATEEYQQQFGPMALALLEKTVTPAALAHLVADQIANKLAEFTLGDLNTGMASEQLKTEPLRRLMQAEFGSSVELQHCLQFNDDYSTVKLASREALASHVIQAFQTIGLLPAKASAHFLLSQQEVPTQQAIEQTSHLAETTVSQHADWSSPAWNASFWLGHTLQGLTNRPEDDRKKSAQHHTGAQTA